MLIVKHRDNIDVCYGLYDYKITEKGLEVYDHKIYNISGKTSTIIHLKHKLPDFIISKNNFDKWLVMSLDNVNQDFKKNKWSFLNKGV
jgi:hypothetical protein